MHTRQLGQSPLQIAPLVLGGNVFGWSADEKRSFAVLDAFVARQGVGIDARARDHDHPQARDELLRVRV